MPIRIDVLPEEEGRVKKLGGLLLPDGKTWVIPDGMKHINRFKAWLPNEEGFIVQRPLERGIWQPGEDGKVFPFVLRTSRTWMMK
jgi:hypothetical protein